MLFDRELTTCPYYRLSLQSKLIYKMGDYLSCDAYSFENIDSLIAYCREASPDDFNAIYTHYESNENHLTRRGLLNRNHYSGFTWLVRVLASLKNEEYSLDSIICENTGIPIEGVTLENCEEYEYFFDGYPLSSEGFQNIGFHCLGCEEAFTRRTTNARSLCDRDGYYCWDCWSNLEYESCENCGDNYAELYDDALCEPCYDRFEERESEPLKDYSYRPHSFKFLKSNKEGTKTPLFFGFELELESRRDSSGDRESFAEYLLETRDSLYCKTDGSLDCGVEVVSHPMTLQYMKESNTFQFIEEQGKAYEMQSFYRSTTGFHVHMGKDAFSNLHLAKWLSFHYNNHKYIEFIAQRKSNGYSRLINVSSDFSTSIKSEAKYKNNETGDRYRAVNITAKTIEMRYFKGNLLAVRNLKNIEFLHCLYYYLKDESLKNISIERFEAYLKLNKRTYPNLFQYVSKRCPTMPWLEDEETSFAA